MQPLQARNSVTGTATSGRCWPSLNRSSSSRRSVAPRALLDLASALAHVDLQQVAQHAPLAYEPVALPCSLMKCGDAIYRSTLDPVLRKEETGLDWRGIALLATVGLYLNITPGVLPGAIDYYFLGPWQRKNGRFYGRKDITMGRKLATGGFGTVYKGELTQTDGKKVPVIIKKANEFGEAEVWMNERMMRVDPDKVAEFITAYAAEEPKVAPTKGGKPPAPDNSVWLVWKYEGDFNLADMMAKRDFPYNLEPLLLGRELKLEKGARRKLVTIKLVMRQMLEALQSCHSTGIVHRDIKPQNCIVSEACRKIKLIDLGAAADLRIGINYVPNEYLLDPRYAPPQQYVMSTQTPKPPPKPVAAFLSPVLWRLNSPDRFDMYSCGVVMLQLVFAPLRSDNAIIAFNKRLQELNYDLNRWRRHEQKSKNKDMQEGFELLDLDGGAGWDLLTQLMAYKPSDRLSASAALAHPWLEIPGAKPSSSLSQSLSSSIAGSLGSIVDSEVVNGTISTVGSVASSVGEAVGSAGKVVGGVLANDFVEDRITRVSDGALTEVELAQELGLQESYAPRAREASQTIAWFQERQAELERLADESGSGKVSVKAAGGSGNGNGKGLVKVPLWEQKPSGAKNGGGKVAVRSNGNGGKAGGSDDEGGSGKGKKKVKALDLLGVFRQ